MIIKKSCLVDNIFYKTTQKQAVDKVVHRIDQYKNSNRK